MLLTLCAILLNKNHKFLHIIGGGYCDELIQYLFTTLEYKHDMLNI